MKITIYELLGMIKDGKAPKKVKYREMIYHICYEYGDYESDIEEYRYADTKEHYYLFEGIDMLKCLNDEVEILEEKKEIPEKLDIRQEKNIKNNWKWKVYGKEHSYNISTPQKLIADKVNALIDYLKSKGE